MNLERIHTDSKANWNAEVNLREGKLNHKEKCKDLT